MKKFFAGRVDFCVYRCCHCDREFNNDLAFKMHLNKSHNVQKKNANLTYYNGGNTNIEIMC